ncbi:hypothetical protein JOQ06_020992 [Pogonophryne albipinna]|uniref:Uncharacterized protein n=1 Tax=Pogonophryne albipinna TaxID=1090488 RepID=A0AAD6BT21_9TELE|nr:hypothetical protein JOQ06_020992 [Pogonophryne albipinna]
MITRTEQFFTPFPYKACENVFFISVPARFMRLFPEFPAGAIHHVLAALPTGAPAGFRALLSPNDNECSVSAQCA